MSLSKPALLAAISYLVLAFVVVLPFNQVSDKGVVSKPPSFRKRCMIVILMVIPICLSVYSINCMVVGKCMVWSWFQSIAIAVWIILFLTASFLAGENVSETYRN